MIHPDHSASGILPMISGGDITFASVLKGEKGGFGFLCTRVR